MSHISKFLHIFFHIFMLSNYSCILTFIVSHPWNMGRNGWIACFITCVRLSNEALAVCYFSAIKDQLLFNTQNHSFILYTVSPVLLLEEIIFIIVLCMILWKQLLKKSLKTIVGVEFCIKNIISPCCPLLFCILWVGCIVALLMHCFPL